MPRYAFFCYVLCNSIDFERVKRFAVELLDLNAVNILVMAGHRLSSLRTPAMFFLLAHPASFAHNFISGMQSFYSASPGIQ